MARRWIVRSAKLSLWMILLGAILVGLVATRIGAGRVFAVDIPYPTETKPQSKLWWAHGHWWAWMPVRDGSSVWKRNEDGWTRVAQLDAWLKEIPGFADVWADAEGVAAVVVGKDRITVARLRFDSADGFYRPLAAPVIWGVPSSAEDSRGWLRQIRARWTSQVSARPVESATITRDESGSWWVAYDLDGRIWVRQSRDVEGTDWEEPIDVSGPVASDDLSAIFNIPGGVGVAWTDQLHDGLYFRQHLRDQPFEQWKPKQIIADGKGTANDHLNAAVAEDGTVYLVSKTSRYVLGEPLLSLHVCRPDTGAWESIRYATHGSHYSPTRPIALLDNQQKHLYLVHTSLDRSVWNSHAIVYLKTDLKSLALNDEEREVIARRIDLRNATSTKSSLPLNAPWLVLASDRFGNVYEGVLPQ